MKKPIDALLAKLRDAQPTLSPLSDHERDLLAAYLGITYPDSALNSGKPLRVGQLGKQGDGWRRYLEVVYCTNLQRQALGRIKRDARIDPPERLKELADQTPSQRTRQSNRQQTTEDALKKFLSRHLKKYDRLITDMRAGDSDAAKEFRDVFSASAIARAILGKKASDKKALDRERKAIAGSKYFQDTFQLPLKAHG